MKSRYAFLKIIIVAATFFGFCSSFAFCDNDWHNVRSWVYQLCDYKGDKLDEIASGDFDLAVIDLSRDGGDNYFTKEEITAVKNSGKIVLSYFSIGSIENYRPEWKDVSDDLKAGKVSGWPSEQYVKFRDERWWLVVQGRVDQSIKAGFNGAYLDMITTYEEIKNSGLKREELAHKMVDLIARISEYAKRKVPEYKIVPQNSPELYTWNYWKPKPNEKYINAIDGIGIESVFYLAHDKLCDKSWCKENRDNAIAIKNAGKLVLGVDYCRTLKCAEDAFKKQQEIGFVPYVSIRNLNLVVGDIKNLEKLIPQKKRKKKK